MSPLRTGNGLSRDDGGDASGRGCTRIVSVNKRYTKTQINQNGLEPVKHSTGWHDDMRCAGEGMNTGKTQVVTKVRQLQESKQERRKTVE